MKNTSSSMGKVEVESRVRDEKIKIMKERQSKWMAEKINNDGRIVSGLQQHPPPDLTPSIGTQRAVRIHGEGRKKSQKDSKSDVVLWTTKNSTSFPDEFVVRSAGSSKMKHSKSKTPTIASSSTYSSDISKTGLRKGNDEVSFSSSTLLHDDSFKHECQSIDTENDKGRRMHTQRPRFTKEYLEEESGIYNNTELESELANGSPQHMTSVTRHVSDLSLNMPPPTSTIKEDFSTHRCPSCSKLMEGSRNEPMICVPCGHSVCRTCSSNVLLCPFCQCKIQSTSINESLKSVICAYKELRRKQELEEKEKQVRKYVEEYETLNMRSSLLQEEAGAIISELETITSHIASKKESRRRSAALAEEKRANIEQLKMELKECENQQQQSEEDLELLDKEYTKSKHRLDILQDTLETICRSKDRVKVLVNSLAPSVSFDDDDEE